MDLLSWLPALGLLFVPASGTPLDPTIRPAAVMRPIRTNEPGTGVFIGTGLLGRMLAERHSNDAGDVMWDSRWITDFRYTPATHWVVGVQVPLVLHRGLERSGAGTVTAAGLGDVVLAVKHRFFRRVGMWSDRHAAVELDLKLPTGATDRGVDPALPVHRRRQLQPGTGSTDVRVDLIYQEARQRFVYGGDLSYTRTTADDRGYRFGNELRLNLDAEYILFPLDYRVPGKEVFVLLEATVVHKQADRVEGRRIPVTERTEVLLAPGIQYIAGERLLLGFSLQLPAWADVAPEGLRRDLSVLTEFRYAF